MKTKLKKFNEMPRMCSLCMIKKTKKKQLIKIEVDITIGQHAKQYYK